MGVQERLEPQWAVGEAGVGVLGGRRGRGGCWLPTYQ